MAENIVVVGGGIVGVFAALRARQLRSNARILVVEQEDALGGLLRSDLHPNGLSFDRGTHVLSETGVDAIDALLFDGLDDRSWRRFGGPERDLAGLLMEGEVHEGSPFLPAPIPLVEARLVEIQDGGQGQPSESLYGMLAVLHGCAITDAVFRRPIRNLYRRELEELDVFVASQLPLSRVVAGDLDRWLARMDDERFRRLVACPDQRRLPSHLASPLSAMYPRRMGIGQLFDKLRAQMADAGIELRLSARITDFSIADGAIGRLGIDWGGGVEKVSGPLHVIWAVPPFQLPAMLGIRLPDAAFAPGWRTVIVDFCAWLTKPMDCYYYIDYGDNDCFRLTNYRALCDEAAGRAASPFTFELWWRGGDFNEAAAHALVAGRFLQLGLIGAPTDICDVRIRRSAHNVLLATPANMTALTELADAVDAVLPVNMTSIGLLCKPGLFFTGDMLRNAELKLSQRMGPA